MLDKTTSDKLNKDVQSYRLVTVATLVDRLKVNGSLARRCLADLEERGVIKPVVTHSKMKIYSTSKPCIICSLAETTHTDSRNSPRRRRCRVNLSTTTKTNGRTNVSMAKNCCGVVMMVRLGQDKGFYSDMATHPGTWAL